MSEARKLAAILVADVVGYSRLAAADEVRTLAHLRGCAAISSTPPPPLIMAAAKNASFPEKNASLSSRLHRFPQLRCSPGRDPKWLLNLDWRTFDRSLRTSARGRTCALAIWFASKRFAMAGSRIATPWFSCA
jgi:hypothetical protein